MFLTTTWSYSSWSGAAFNRSSLWWRILKPHSLFPSPNNVVQNPLGQGNVCLHLPFKFTESYHVLPHQSLALDMIHFTLIGKHDKQKASDVRHITLNIEDTESAGTLSLFPPHHLYLSLHRNHNPITDIQMFMNKG